MSRVFISYRHVKPDDDLASFLEKHLSSKGHQVFIDNQILIGTKWVEEIERQIRAAEHFVVLLSKDSIRSDMVRQEVKLAHELMRQHQLTILPIRVAFFGELPLDLASLLNPIQYALWEQGAPFETIGAQILAAIERATALPISGKSNEEEASVAGMQSLFEATEAVGAPLPQADPRLVPRLELETGTIKLDSPFYIRRQSDDEMLQQVSRIGTTTVVKGPRQMGKSSLLARAMAAVQQNQQKALYLDFQFVDSDQLTNLDSLLRYLCRKFARAFKTATKPDEFWDNSLGAKDNLTDFIEEAILAETPSPIWVLFDEADRVFNFPYRDDFFATLRGWHNLRAIREHWRRFNLVIAHSTEPYLWIQDINQSPFNVGYPIRLTDFNFDQVAELNLKHGTPLKTSDEIQQLLILLGGQPFLVRLALYLLATNRWSLAELQNLMTDDFGPFGDHLRRFVWGLQRNPALKESLRQILRHQKCDDEMHFLRLRAVGLIKGEARDAVAMRCQLYEQYFKNHL